MLTGATGFFFVELSSLERALAGPSVQCGSWVGRFYRVVIIPVPVPVPVPVVHAPVTKPPQPNGDVVLYCIVL